MSTTKTQTIQDVLDSSGEQRDVMDIVVGAALANESLADNPEIISQYDALSIEQKEIINFVVGAKVSGMSELKHQTDVEEFLSHFGVKGQKWGIRNDDKSSGRTNSVALKSTGHRVVNGVLGDKTFWKNTAIIAGVTGVGIGASFALPAAIPASTLITIGQYAGGAAGLSGYATTASLAAFGSQVVTAMGITATALAGTATLSANYLANIGRAIIGSQKVGSIRVNEILDKKMKHSDLSSATMSEAEEFLAHWGVKGMRWGIRRSDRELASARASGDTADSDRAAATQKRIKTSHSLSVASDSDLTHLVNRLNLEKRYADISSTKTSSTKSSSTKTLSLSNPGKQTHSLFKGLLNVGDTMNKAYVFANSSAGRIVANKLGFYEPGPGLHAALPENVISVPSVSQILKDRRADTYIGKHRR